MTDEHDGESIEWARPAALPGTELLLARRCARVWHMFHERYVICACTKNVAVDWRYRGRTHSLYDGDYMLVEPGETHRNLVVRKAADFNVLFISPDVVAEAARELGFSAAPHLRLPQDSNPLVFRAFGRFFSAFKAGASVLEQQSHFAACVQLVLENYLEQTPPVRGVVNEHRAVARVKDYLRDRFSESISLDALATMTGLNRFYLLRTFVQHTGLPPHAYQIHVRVERARMLLETGAPPANAAVWVGFADQSHLARHFKRIHGITPGGYARAVA